LIAVDELLLHPAFSPSPRIIRWRVARPSRGAVSTPLALGNPDGHDVGRETRVAGFEREALPSIAPEDVEAQRRRPFVASGLG
jgi:hypothetical protein